MPPRISTKALLSIFSSILMAGASHATVLIDFGAAGTTTTTDALNRSWNNVTPTTQTSPFGLLALTDTTNAASGVSLGISSTMGNNMFSDSNGNGDNPSKGNALARNYPTTATQDNLYGYSVASGGAFTNPSGPVTLTLTGFAAGRAYDFFGFAARNSNDNRSEILSFQGAGSAVNLVYDPGMNTTGSTFASGDIIASTTGQITLTLSPNTTNVSPSQFFYLGVLEFSPAAVPEPTSLSLLGLGVGAGAVGLLRRRRGDGEAGR